MGIFGKKKTEEKKDLKKDAKPKALKSDAAKKAKTEKAKKETSSMKDLYANQAKAISSAEKSSKSVSPAIAYRILIKPLITEKAANLGSQNKYVFEVAVKTNKIDVAKAVKEIYGIKPLSVNIINERGKKVRRGRTFGKRKDWKKAVVTLPEGQTINIYEGV